MANFGLIIRNSIGDVLIDGERRHPLLYAEGELSPPDNVFPFPPTENPVFPTWRVIEGECLLVGLTRDDNGRYNGVRFVLYPPGGPYTIYVWVYEL